MWFKMPKGCGGISVERQEFGVEFTDNDGGNYFRAPDHFAPMIIGMGMGFTAVDQPPNAPDDLPKADPVRDNAIAQLTGELQNARADVAAATAQIIALSNEKNDLKKLVEKLTARTEELEEKMTDEGVVVPMAQRK
jgi:hypothetical protein